MNIKLYIAMMAVVNICNADVWVDKEPAKIIEMAMVNENQIKSYVGVSRDYIDAQSKHYIATFTSAFKDNEGRSFRKIAIDPGEKTARPQSVFVVNKDGDWFQRGGLLVKLPHGFIDLMEFNTNAFENLVTAASADQYRTLKVLSRNDGKQAVIIEMRLTQDQITDLTRDIDRKKSDVKILIGGGGIDGFPGVTNAKNIVPVRAIYKIAGNTPFITEKAYYTSDDVLLVKTRSFDSIDANANLSEKDFVLKPASKFYAPKTFNEYWEVLKKHEP